MGKYFVLPIAMTLKNNKIAEHGDVVDESQLNSSPYELIKGDFIRHLTDEEAKEHGEDFEEAEIVEDNLSDEEKAALAQKEKEEQEAADLKKKEEEEAAEKLRIENEEKAAASNLSAKDKAKELLNKK